MEEPPRKLCMNIIARNSVQTNCMCTVTSPRATYGASTRRAALALLPHELSTRIK